MNAIRCLVASIIFFIALPFDIAPLSNLLKVTGNQWFLMFAALSLGVALGDTFYLIALKEMGVSRTLALTGTFPLATLIWQTILLKVPLNPTLITGSLLVVLGVVVLSRSGEDNEEPINLYRNILLALCASICWGFSATLLKPATVNMTSIQANAIRMPLIAFLLFFLRVLPSGNENLRGIKLKNLLIVSATGILGMGLGAFLFIYAITEIDPATVVTITSSSPLFGMLFAAIFLKERITKHVGLGIFLCLAGVYAVL